MPDENLNFPSEGNYPSNDNYPGVSPFERIKQINPYGIEYWSARDLAPLLGYSKWERFEGAIKRAMTACEQTGNIIDQHFPSAGKTSPIKAHKNIDQKEDLLDRIGRAELAANDFRITQAEEQLRQEGAVGEQTAIEIHHDVGKKVRRAIEDIGGRMPEDLPAEPSIKPLVDEKRRKERKHIKKSPPLGQSSLFNAPNEGEGGPRNDLGHCQ